MTTRLFDDVVREHLTASTKVEVRVKKLHKDARLPTYATDGSGCFDIYTYEGVYLDPDIPTETLRTGLVFEIPEGHVMLVFSRSGHGFNNDVRLANCVGVIDSDYRGELKVKLVLDDLKSSGFGLPYKLQGNRIAQALIVPIPRVSFEETEFLSETSRGIGGFGSTGT